MVHSGSASPMKTTPSGSPHLSAPATAPLAPPPGDQEPVQTPAKLLTPDLNSNSDQTEPSTPTPVEVKPPGVTPKTLARKTGEELLVQTPAADNGPINGRTSGRKRTPKACDCCGPNGTGHSVKTPGRGRGGGSGRGRGRGRGVSHDLTDTPKRKAGGQLTRIKYLESKEIIEKVEDEVDRSEQVKVPVVETDTKAQKPLMPIVKINPRIGLLRNISIPGKDDVKEGSAGESKDVEMRLSGSAGLGTPGRGSAASKIGEVVCGIRRSDYSGIFLNPKTYGRPRVVVSQRPGQQTDAGIVRREQTDHSSNKTALGNGDTVNLSDTEPEEDDLIVGEMANGLTSVSKQSGSPLDLDSEMQVDQTPEKTESLSIAGTLSNGNTTSPTNDDNCPVLMQVETSLPPKIALPPPPPESPITLRSTEHPGALRDHWLYCRTGTWEKEEMEAVKGQSGEMDGQERDEEMQNEESPEQLIDMVHEFLESFYLKYGGFIPLSETDVLEYLKKKSSDYSDLSNRGLDIKGQMSRYRAALASAPIAGFTVTYNKHNLSLEDLGTLEEQNWLNDQIINMYGELIMEATQHKVHFFNSFFHKQLVAKGYEGVKRWTKKVDLFSKWLLLIPIHLEIHWSLITVTMATKTISYYDSQGIVFRHTTDNIMKYLLSEAKEKKQAAFQKGWKITIIKGIPQQKNDSDCGVFVLEYCRCLSVKQPLLFTQEDMPRIRKRIYKELCDCRLND